MKGSLIAVGLVSLVCLLASCERKEYTCTCKVTSGGTAASTYAFPLGKMNKSTAEDKCNDKQLSYQNTGTVASCYTE